jgi:hypothetical protein
VPISPPDIDRIFAALADHTRRDIPGAGEACSSVPDRLVCPPVPQRRAAVPLRASCQTTARRLTRSTKGSSITGH